MGRSRRSTSTWWRMVSMSNRISARTELYAVEHDPSRDIAVYLHDVATRVARLTALGITVPELEQKDVILMRLHPSFHTARAVIVTTAEEPDLAGVKDLLLTSAASDPSVTVKSEPADLAMAARLKPGSNPFQGSIGPHGFPQDNEGHRWCDPTNKNCHRCGHSGHIAAKCMYSMPQFVKDWILRNSNSSSPSAAFAAALAAGLTPESFSDHYHHHVGTSGHAKSARVTESASFAAGAGVNYPASWNEGDDEDSESWDEADELNRYLAAAAAPTPAARAATSSAKSRSSRIILHT
ncbi:hypothetical protein B0H16DRAFT_387250 [Mycena metata]|uniref:CCHC-type domain-containing protein n=1 Tax=Mycena metata TaxID=1033252 RepID=A0AAD7JM48_9AGAR|nr:hypothetical protein B0H16DRAFT_387250 [Mycena metata]